MTSLQASRHCSGPSDSVGRASWVHFGRDVRKVSILTNAEVAVI